MSSVFAGLAILGCLYWLTIAMLALCSGRQRPADPAMDEDVSIVIPAYNEEAVLGSCLAAVKALNPAPAQVIVVDDGSVDRTAEIAAAALAGWPRGRVVRLPRNRGKATALNTGLAELRSPLVLTLDADTLVSPDCLGRAVSAIRGRDGVACNVRAAGSGWLARLQACEYTGRLNLERRAQSVLGAITTLPGAATLRRRSALRAMGGFSGRTLAEDTDLTLTAQQKGLQLGFADLAVARTIVPHSLGALMRQRGRWFWGNAACALIHWPGTDSSGRFRIIAAVFALLNLGSAPSLLVSCLLAVGLLEEGRIAFVSLFGLLTVMAGVLCAAVGFHKDRQPLPPPWVVLPSLVLAPIITMAATVSVCGRRLTGPIGWGREPLQRLSEWSAADRPWPGVAKRTGSRLDLS